MREREGGMSCSVGVLMGGYGGMGYEGKKEKRGPASLQSIWTRKALVGDTESGL